MGETCHDMMHDMWMHVFKDLAGLVVTYSFDWRTLYRWMSFHDN